MNTISNYIFEKLHLRQGWRSYPELKDMISKYKDENKCSAKTLENLERVCMRAKEEANKAKATKGVVKCRGDNDDFAWVHWRNEYTIGAKTIFGEIIFKIYPDA